jgi:hypothetical protein
MNKLKYIAAVLIGIAGLGLQQVKACQSTLNTGPNNTSGFFGTVTWDLVGQTATFTFTAAPGFFFVDGRIADLNLSSTNVLVGPITGNLPGTFASQVGSFTVNGFGDFTLITTAGNAATHYSTITFSVTNLSGTWTTCDSVLALNSQGFDAAAHVISTGTGLTFFVAEVPGGGGVPDGGTTVMLLGAALGALGVVRRFLLS